MKTLQITPDEIFATVCEYYNVNKSEAGRKCRDQQLVRPRQVAHYLAKKYTAETWREIGGAIGHCDHATVMYSSRTVDGLITPIRGAYPDRVLAEDIRRLKHLIMQKAFTVTEREFMSMGSY